MSSKLLHGGPRPIVPGLGNGRDLVLVSTLAKRLERLHHGIGLPPAVLALVEAALFGPLPNDDANDA